MQNCPCCSNQMLRQVYDKKMYWFCRHCWEIVPIYNLNHWGSLSPKKLLKTAPSKNNFMGQGSVNNLTTLTKN